MQNSNNNNNKNNKKNNNFHNKNNHSCDDTYNFKEVETKWQKHWQQNETFKALNNRSLPKFYALVEFPYPSANGLHVGHPRSYGALDIISSKRRMEGFNVLFPMGWDAFGLPAENFAIKNQVHPQKITEQNISNFKKQLQQLGLSFDWSREISTTDPDYYKWTQWIFIQMFKNGLAYKQPMRVNWCTNCNCVLANEEVVDGVCERCGSEVAFKNKSQWMLKITKYAQRLIDDLNQVDFIEKIKTQQKNWIGLSTGGEIEFKTTANFNVKIYTTRPETIFGVTYIAVAPEHPLIAQKANDIENLDEILAYKKLAEKKSEFERSNLIKEKTGVEIKGIKAINPVNLNEIPIFVADYVLINYASGAIMAVPAHDERDLEFANKFGLEVVPVINDDAKNENDKTITNSGFLNGLTVEQAKLEILNWLERENVGKKKTNYKLRDWVFARQRYWGEPIPIVFCQKCGTVAVPESELPLTLPQTTEFAPGKNGESPLTQIKEFVNTTCPKCGGPAKRETDTMPQWAGSSWYYLRYCSPHCETALAQSDDLNYWLPVDWYNGGMEHTTLHLLYSRFWHKVLYDLGVVKTKEPYLKRTSHGMILGSNGEKMSKSRGNVVNPDDIIEQFGADVMRLYEMFMGDFEKVALWNTSSIKGCKRFLERFWNLKNIIEPGNVRKECEVSLNKLIKKVSDDIELMKFNTAIAAQMSFLNEIYDNYDAKITTAELEILISLLNPFAPHITEELNSILNFENQVAFKPWPQYDPEKCVESSVEIPVCINGKVRSTISIKVNANEQTAVELATLDAKTALALQGKKVIKRVFVPNKMLNFVVV